MRRRSLLYAIAGLVPLQGSALAASPASAAQDLIDDYSTGYGALGMAPLALSYVDNLQTLVRETDLAGQARFFDGMAHRLRALDARQATPCQQLALTLIAFEVDVNQRKLDLLRQFIAQGGAARINGNGLHAQPMGAQWYGWFCLRWLTLPTTPEQLMAMGERELATVLTRYHALQARMGYGGRDAEFAAYLASPEFRYPEGQTPQADFEQRQAIVYRNLDKLFLPMGIQPPPVRQSSRGMAMPADAYYMTDEGVFYFNKARPAFERRSVDWLLLHESTPGHHYQTRYARARQACTATLPRVFYPGFSEGWAAYVEEFGATLGLYRQDSDALGALEWDLVRSIRVVLDVGINARGWSQAQAMDYWQRRLPMLPDLAEREIARVRNWPVQAIAYKQGAVLLREMRTQEQARLGERFDIRHFHDRVLRHGAVPLALLPGLLREPETAH